jgi:hypothetical protein
VTAPAQKRSAQSSASRSISGQLIIAGSMITRFMAAIWCG